jgi:hypothetical protein
MLGDGLSRREEELDAVAGDLKNAITRRSGSRAANVARRGPIESRVEFEAGPAANNSG